MLRAIRHGDGDGDVCDGSGDVHDGGDVRDDGGDGVGGDGDVRDGVGGRDVRDGDRDDDGDVGDWVKVSRHRQRRITLRFRPCKQTTSICSRTRRSRTGYVGHFGGNLMDVRSEN